MWSNERKSYAFGNLYEMTVRCRLTNMMLGTQSGNPDMFRDYIVSKAPEEALKEEELANAEAMISFNPDEEIDKAATVFPKGKFYKTKDNVFYDPIHDTVPDGVEVEEVIVPFIWDYQWRGSFKESISMLVKASGKKSKAALAKEGEKTQDLGKTFAAASLTSYKKAVDGGWFIKQRRIPLLVPETWVDDLGNEHPSYDDNGNLHMYTRPLRADTAQGPRVALACSEFVPKGTEFYFTVQLLNKKDKNILLETLDFKEKVGMLQWRGGGKGTLIWTPADSEGKPIDEIP